VSGPKELGEPVELLTSPRADELSVLLEQINVRSVVYCLSDLGAPWGLQVDASATAKFHLVLDGRATLTLAEPGVSRRQIHHPNMTTSGTGGTTCRCSWTTTMT
jgi:Cupin